jgi:uncharacterized protein
MHSTDVTPFSEGSIRGFLHRPSGPCANKLVVTHGAGGNCRAPLLIALADAFSDAGYAVLRCDLPFRQRRPFGPPLPKSSAEDRAALAEAVAAMRALGPGAVFLGGHSYGGRQASILASEEPASCDALLLLSYPLHPPNRPGQLRTGHFPDLQTPMLFIHGTQDPFGSIDEMRSALTLIPARTELIAIEGAGHDLKRGKFDIQKLVVDKFARLIRR